MTGIPLHRAPTIRDEMIALKRERILESAIELFYARGYENTTLEAVAERLSFTKPFIYSYFKSKTELLGDICGRGISASLDAMEATSAMKLTATEKLRRLGREFATAVLRNQKAIAIFSREEKNLTPADFARISGMRREFDQKLSALLEQGVRAREFEIADIRLAALAIGGMVSWAYVWYRPNGRLALEEVAERIAALILSMVGAETGEANAGRRAKARSNHRKSPASIGDRGKRRSRVP